MFIYKSNIYHASSEVRIEGLEKIDYVDNLKNQERFTDGLNAITFDSEVINNNYY